MSLYVIVLFAHSYLRWLVLLCLLWLLARSLHGWLAGRPWTPTDERLHRTLLGSVDLQFLLGIALYLGLSPFVRGFWANLALGMKTAPLRFFGVEHVFSMLIAIVVLHVGRARSRRALELRQRQRRVFVSLVAALLLILIGIPWPFLPYGRPLWRTALAASAPSAAGPASTADFTPNAAVNCRT